MTTAKHIFKTRVYYSAELILFAADGSKKYRELYSYSNAEPIKVNMREIEAELYLAGMDRAEVKIYASHELYRGRSLIKTITARSPLRAMSPLHTEHDCFDMRREDFERTHINPPVIAD